MYSLTDYVQTVRPAAEETVPLLLSLSNNLVSEDITFINFYTLVEIIEKMIINTFNK